MEEHTSSEFSIYKSLCKKILLGEIHEGERLVETMLAAQYQASRLHIKSALRLLEQEHLAQHIPQCGFVAKEVTGEAIAEIVELRIALERVVFQRLMEVISEEEIAYLRKVTQHVVVFMQNDMKEDAMERVDHFYSFVYEKSCYERITSILDTYTDYLKIIRRRSASDEARNQASLKLLQDIMDAIEQRDTNTLLHHIERRRIEAE